jgi:hypothetical protein
LISLEHEVYLYCSCGDKNLSEWAEEYSNFSRLELLLPMDVFNKSKLLNNSLKTMRQDFDVVCIFDIDMIYNYNFFNQIEKFVHEGFNYIVSYGRKLTKEETENIMVNKPNHFGTQEKKFKGCSQITMTKPVLNYFLECFGAPLYDEYFEGWGGEDSDLSFKSNLLDLNKTTLDDVWFHLWHLENRPKNYRETDKNSIYFQNKKAGIRKAVDNYVS